MFMHDAAAEWDGSDPIRVLGVYVSVDSPSASDRLNEAGIAGDHRQHDSYDRCTTDGDDRIPADHRYWPSL